MFPAEVMNICFTPGVMQQQIWQATLPVKWSLLFFLKIFGKRARRGKLILAT